MTLKKRLTIPLYGAILLLVIVTLMANIGAVTISNSDVQGVIIESEAHGGSGNGTVNNYYTNNFDQVLNTSSDVIFNDIHIKASTSWYNGWGVSPVIRWGNDGLAQYDGGIAGLYWADNNNGTQLQLRTSKNNYLNFKGATITATSGFFGSGALLTGISGSQITNDLGWINQSSSPNGNNTSVQFNDGGVFGGDNIFTYNKTNNILNLFTPNSYCSPAGSNSCNVFDGWDEVSCETLTGCTWNSGDSTCNGNYECSIQNQSSCDFEYNNVGNCYDGWISGVNGKLVTSAINLTGGDFEVYSSTGHLLSKFGQGVGGSLTNGYFGIYGDGALDQYVGGFNVHDFNIATSGENRAFGFIVRRMSSQNYKIAFTQRQGSNLKASMEIDTQGNVYIGSTDWKNAESRLTVDGNVSVSGKSIFSDTMNIKNNLTVNGTAQFKNPYAMYSSTATQTIAVASTAYPVTFNETETSYLITKSSDNANFSVAYAGNYLIEISAIADVDTANKHIEIWTQKNGVNVPRSNTLTHITAVTAEQVIAVPFIISLNTTDKFRIMYASDDAGSRLINTPATAYSPGSPSIIMTITKISDNTP